MAADTNKLILVNIKGPSGDNFVMIDKSLAELLESDTCDPETRKAIIDAACGNQNLNVEVLVDGDSNNNTLISNRSTSDSSSSKDTCTTITASIPTQCSSQGSEIHTWTESEEKLLISLRGNMESKFLKTRNHDPLWEEILAEMKDKKVKVTKLQIINKWKNLRKKYKEVKDSSSKTGTDPQKWKHTDCFDDLFGHKESTRPAIIIDSGKEGKAEKPGGETPDESEPVAIDINKASHSKRKAPPVKVSNKEKLMKHLDGLEQKQQEALTKLDEQHKAKMERLDRLLNIFERAVDKMAPNK